MAFKKHDRQYDVVVFGATGYTGLMTAEHIAATFPTNTRWAVAGRSADKLQHVVSECQKINQDRLAPAVEVCNLNDADLAQLARKTCVLISTVGPYAKYGEHAFKACAEAGTHYLDCTGEAVWTLDMITKYEATAKRSGACLISQNGVESAPSDVMAYVLAQTIKKELEADTGDVVVSVHTFKAKASGGTFATALNLFESYGLRQIGESHKPYALSPVKSSEPTPRASIFSMLTGLYNIPVLGTVCTSIASRTNAAIVFRSWGLAKSEPALSKQYYGPKFTYREFMRPKSKLHGVIMHYGIIYAGLLLAFVPPFRALLRRFYYQPGQGPERESTHKDQIELRGVATPDFSAWERQPPAGKARQLAYARGNWNGSMYLLTAMLLGQAALTMLEDDVPMVGGVYTPATLGQGFIDRIDDRGFKIESELVDA
ncbi:saccharopine dehydrogenase [Microdochium trichocladiopsis]|uniref:Saccharopine dehydrogenase n=1 Tax=Microdochium trichocladiopsis TaxID=1682393 RepID=A0A9P8YF64_9PEZI|nr:saccharopine dehydrogenase [Microdochium trichocladiopsis]KAH7038104.1 saccharopine dehydrogenase [Microdochium trichocladiopsis]